MLVEAAPEYAIFSVDLRGQMTSWNKGAERLLGWNASEIVGASADVIFTTKDRTAGIPEQERLQALEKGRAEDDRWLLRKDGSRLWATELMMPLQDSRGGFIKILRDRTEDHLGAERLQRSEERFRLLVSSIPQLVFRSRPDGNRTWPSPQWIEFTGLGAEASKGFGWLDAIHLDDRRATMAAWSEAERSGEYYVENRVKRRSDGQYRWHQTRARPIEGRPLEETEWFGTMNDVHDLKGLQDRQRVLLAEVQHRTRNLLGLVQTIANMTLRRSDSLPSFAAEFEHRLQALSRVQALVISSNHEDVDLHDLLTAELEAYVPGPLGVGRISLDGPAVPLRSTPAQSLGLALHELTTNAVKHGALATRSGRLSVSWTFGPGDIGSSLRLIWRETGLALPSSEARHMGFGRELIERALPYELGAQTALAFEPDGVRCTIVVEL
jgi:PAS domain S-box-containing protein